MPILSIIGGIAETVKDGFNSIKHITILSIKALIKLEKRNTSDFVQK